MHRRSVHRCPNLMTHGLQIGSCTSKEAGFAMSFVRAIRSQSLGGKQPNAIWDNVRTHLSSSGSEKRGSWRKTTTTIVASSSSTGYTTHNDQATKISPGRACAVWTSSAHGSFAPPCRYSLPRDQPHIKPKTVRSFPSVFPQHGSFRFQNNHPSVIRIQYINKC